MVAPIADLGPSQAAGVIVLHKFDPAFGHGFRAFGAVLLASFKLSWGDVRSDQITNQHGRLWLVWWRRGDKGVGRDASKVALLALNGAEQRLIFRHAQRARRRAIPSCRS